LNPIVEESNIITEELIFAILASKIPNRTEYIINPNITPNNGVNIAI
jgi:hypothetical protein